MRRNFVNSLKQASVSFTTKTASGNPLIPITIGRYQPLHKGHQHVIETLKNGSSILANPEFEDSHLPPAIVLIGSSGEERDMVKNPFSFEQRAKMFGLVAPWLPGSDDPRNSPAFYPYVGTYDERRPPVLDNMAQKIKDHCAKHNIPLGYLLPTICIKSDDKREFQIYGQKYHGHQMDVVGKGLGLRCHAEDVSDVIAIHATHIRKDLSQNFHKLDPKILQYVEEQLMLAKLNNRDVGVSQSGDRYGIIHAREALADLMSEGHMLVLDGSKAKIVEIPPERRELFSHYIKAENISISEKLAGAAILSEAQKKQETKKTISDFFPHDFDAKIITMSDLVKKIVLGGEDSVTVSNSSQEMEIVPHISRDGFAFITDAEKEFLSKVNRGRDQKISEELKRAIDSGQIGINDLDGKGDSLLHLSLKNGLIQTTKMLLEKGVEFPIMVRGPQNSPLHKLAFSMQDSFAPTYEECSELGNILVDHSYEVSVAGKLINPPRTGSKDNIVEKKERLLSQNIFITDADETTEEKRKELCSKIVDGADVKKSNAQFVTITEDGQESHFLKKSKCVGPETKYGSDLFDVLSKGHYSAKKEYLQRGDDGKVGLLIEFDENLSPDSFLNKAAKSIPDFDKDHPENQKFLVGYSRMCGVMQVLGEPDRNLANFLLDEKSGKPVKIDNGFLVNYQKYPFGDIYESGGRSHSRNSDNPLDHVDYDVEPTDRFRIYGSAQSRDFLVCLLANGEYQNMQALIDKAKIDFGQNETAPNLKILADSYITAYNKGLNEELFGKIIENISKPENKHLEAAFMSFMSGVNDAIRLAKDDEFLDAYTKKYEDEGVINIGILASKCKAIFKENALEAKQQFAVLLNHFDKLKSKPEYLEYSSESSRENASSEIRAAGVESLVSRKDRLR